MMGPVGAQFHKTRVGRAARIVDGASSGPRPSTDVDVARARATSSLVTCSAPRAVAPGICAGPICAIVSYVHGREQYVRVSVTREAFHVKRRLGTRLHLADHPAHLPVGDRASETPGPATPDVALIR